MAKRLVDFLQEYHRQQAASEPSLRQPAVLIEATVQSEHVVGNASSAKPWTTARVRLVPTHKERDAGRLADLGELVSDGSVVHQLVNSQSNHSPNVCIGRAPRNDIVIPDETISTLHATVELIGERRRLTDHNSFNGTWINKQRISHPITLNTGDCVRLGRCVFYYLSGDALELFLQLRLARSGNDALEPKD